MTMRSFEILDPSNEKELRKELRRRKALADGALKLNAIEELDELSRARGQVASKEEIDLRFDTLHRGVEGTSLPFLTGSTHRHLTDTIGAGRLEVTGDPTAKPKDRKLKLYISED